MKSFNKEKVLKRALGILLAVIMIVPTAIPAFAAGEGTEGNYDFQKYADSTSNLILNQIDTSTMENGNIWVDKEVSSTSLPLRDVNGNIIENDALKANDDSFVVGLSALSQAYEVTTITQTEIKKTANVSLVMDLSTSMTKNPLSTTDKTSRLELLKKVSKEFVEALYQTAQKGFKINLSIITYGGIAKVSAGWTDLNESTVGEIESIIQKLEAVNYKDNTNFQAPLALAEYMYTSKYAPKSYGDKNTNNYVVFMSDGAPNRSHTRDVAIDPYGAKANGQGLQTTTYYETRVINGTDYRHDSASTALKEIEDIYNLSNMTVFSLGLGGWFTSSSEESEFPTAPNIMKLIAAVGNGVMTAEEAYQYLGEDVPDGSMMGTNPSYPYYEFTDANGNAYNKYDVFKSGKQYYISDKDKKNTFYPTLDALKEGIETKFGTIEQRKQQGIFTIPDYITASVFNYYAGNTVEKFSHSFTEISTLITTSLKNYVTNTTKTSSEDALTGNVTIIDNIGEYMQMDDNGGLRGVMFDGKLYTGASCAESLIERLSNGEKYTESEYDVFRKIIKTYFHVSLSDSQIQTWLESSVAGGDMQYTSNTDFNSRITAYTGYDSTTHQLSYKGMYYDENGNVNPIPEGASYITSEYFILDNVGWQNIVGDEEVSMLCLGMLCSTAISTGKQTITFSIPAALLPQREVTVSDGKAKLINTAIPITMVYDVKIKEDFYTVRSDYPYFAENGDPILYTNRWSADASSRVNTVASYSPNTMNPYYSLQKDSPIYVKTVENGETVYKLVKAEDFDANGTYYYYHEFTTESGAASHYDSINEYYEINNSEYIVNDEGYMCIPKGTVKNTNACHKPLAKSENNTNTYPNSYDPSYTVLSDGTIDVRAVLGNNGAVVVPQISVSSKIEWADGKENHKNDVVKVQLYAIDENGKEVPAGDPITVTAEDNWEANWENVAKFTNDGKSVNYSTCKVVDSTNGGSVSEVPLEWDSSTKSYSQAVVTLTPASCNYEFYLADNEGNPIDDNGNKVDFDNRILVGNSGSKEINSFNETTITASEVIGENSNYMLVDNAASYAVVASDINNEGYANIKGLGTVIAAHEDNYHSSTVSFAVKKTTLNADAIVIDYGKSVLIDATANDAETTSVDLELKALSTTAFGAVEVGTGHSKEALSTATTILTKYGKAEVINKDGKNVVKYTPTTYMDGIDSFWYVTKDICNDSYYRYQKISVIPATTMFYEEDFGTDDGVYICYTGAWQTVTDDGEKTDGVTAAGTNEGYQDTSFVGSGDNYGYDSSYENDAKFSNGSSAVVIGTSKNDGKGGILNETSASFTFTGTGFEIISRTDIECGMITVSVTDTNGKLVANVPVFNKGVSTLYQIPVIRYYGLTYGTYSVKINVTVPITLPGLTGNSVFYLDGIKVFDPLGTSAEENADFTEGNNAHDKDNEANGTVESLRDKIISSSKLNLGEKVPGVIWVDTFDDAFQTGGIVSTDKISDYVSYGPNEEVYLAAGNAIGFEFTTPIWPASIQISAKASTGVAEMSVYTSGSEKAYTHAVRTSSEMYYDVSNYIDLKENADGTFTGTIMIYNSEKSESSKNILSVKDLKVTYKNEDITSMTTYTSSLETYKMVFNSVKAARNCATPLYSINSVKVDTTKAYNFGDRATVSFNASEYVDSYAIFDGQGNLVTQQSDSSYVDSSKFISEELGYAKIWTIGFDVENVLTGDYTIVGYHGDEQVCAAVFTIGLERKLAAEGIAVNEAYEGNVVVDEDKGLIYGLEVNPTEIEDYIFADIGYSFELEMTEGVIGTGTILNVYDSEGKLVKAYTIVIYGDAMGDGSIDAFDIAVLGELVNNSADIASLGVKGIALDVNADGCLDSYDYAIVIAAANYETEINQNGAF